MSNRPRSRRNRLLAAAGALAAVVAAILGSGEDAMPLAVAAVFSGCAGAVCLWGAASAHLDARSLARLRDPANQVARWQVSAATWGAFLEFEASSAGRPERGPNLLDARQAPPLPVIATRRAILVGDDFHDVGRTASAGVQGVELTESEPPCVELRGRIRLRYGSKPFALRVPVEAKERAAAEALVTAWRAELLEVRRTGSGSPLRARNIGLGVAAFGVVLVAMALNAPFMTFSRMITSSFAAAFFGGIALSLFGLWLAVGYHREIR